ncbi:hypothetical protein [Streptomyces sp. NPDC058694]|uniref:hypothetical protein n=1 Tax=Streptomyces sp. NPDC058694 TaxID=3346603 RepID=UPI0036590BBC
MTGGGSISDDRTQSTDLRSPGLETMRSVASTGTRADGADLSDGAHGEDLIEIGLINVWAMLWARKPARRVPAADPDQPPTHREP